MFKKKNMVLTILLIFIILKPLLSNDLNNKRSLIQRKKYKAKNYNIFLIDKREFTNKDELFNTEPLNKGIDKKIETNIMQQTYKKNQNTDKLDLPKVINQGYQDKYENPEIPKELKEIYFEIFKNYIEDGTTDIEVEVLIYKTIQKFLTSYVPEDKRHAEYDKERYNYVPTKYGDSGAGSTFIVEIEIEVIIKDITNNSIIHNKKSEIKKKKNITRISYGKMQSMYYSALKEAFIYGLK
ncbi:MAG: hypothetical protein KAT05_11770 [Spirochaetes bacterium]|nr:hypothetical protein [Spirochaetota bacterium]